MKIWQAKSLLKRPNKRPILKDRNHQENLVQWVREPSKGSNLVKSKRTKDW